MPNSSDMSSPTPIVVTLSTTSTFIFKVKQTDNIVIPDFEVIPSCPCMLCTAIKEKLAKQSNMLLRLFNKGRAGFPVDRFRPNVFYRLLHRCRIIDLPIDTGVASNVFPVRLPPPIREPGIVTDEHLGEYRDMLPENFPELRERLDFHIVEAKRLIRAARILNTDIEENESRIGQLINWANQLRLTINLTIFQTKKLVPHLQNARAEYRKLILYHRVEIHRIIEALLVLKNREQGTSLDINTLFESLPSNHDLREIFRS